MRKIIYIIIPALFMSVLSFGQYEPKGSVTRAETALNSNKLDNAKAEIDLAFEVNKKGKVTTNARNWYIRGNVYKAIYENNEEFKDLDPDAHIKAGESYQKVIEIEDKPNGMYTVFADQAINNLYSIILDEGAKAYQEDKYKEAYEAFYNALAVKPDDSLALLYAGTSAQIGEMYQEAADIYARMIETGDATESIVKSLIYIYKVPLEDVETAMKFVDKGAQMFPEDDDFVQEKIYYLITSGKSEDAEKELKAAIQRDPEDAVLHYQLGYLYDEVDRDDEALEAYKKAFEIRPDYYEATFNYGAIHYNRAADILKEFNDIPLGKDYKKYAQMEKEYEEKAATHFKKALPYLEKAHQIKGDDEKLLEILGGVYTRLDMEEKAKEVEAKLSAISGGDEN